MTDPKSATDQSGSPDGGDHYSSGRHSAGSEFWAERFDAHRDCGDCPSLATVSEWFDELLGLLFEQRTAVRFGSLEDLQRKVGELERRLVTMLAASWAVVAGEDEQPSPERDEPASAGKLVAALPSIHRALCDDAEAILRADPAARNRDEVLRAYPGFYAIAAYRVAHVLHGEGALLLARMLTSAAHGSTGIDIHPAARIGRRFCIDHGTGVVIGETTIVGDDVTLYQGVTLGGLSVRKSDANNKRHPTIQDRVTIYSGASILGGETVVGHDSIIGGNVWLTRPVPPHSRISYRAESTLPAGLVAEPEVEHT